MHHDSAESSATSTGTIIMNQNALKPKNNQTHSVSQMSLQTTGITAASCTHHKSPNSNCKCTTNAYPVLPASCNKEQQPPASQQLLLPSTSSYSSCSNSISSSTSISTAINSTSATITTGRDFFQILFKDIFDIMWQRRGHFNFNCLTYFKISNF